MQSFLAILGARIALFAQVESIIRTFTFLGRHNVSRLHPRSSAQNLRKFLPRKVISSNMRNNNKTWVWLLAFLLMFEATLSRPVEQNDAISSFDVPVQNGSTSLNGIQKFIYSYLEPKPLVDTIREEEKYGNEGDVLGGVGRAIVGGTEHITVFTANAISLPGSVFRRVIGRLSDNLGRMGAQIVGL